MRSKSLRLNAFCSASAGSYEQNIIRLERLSTYYKGRISLMELFNMPCSMFQILYKIAYEKMQSEEGKKEIESSAIEDTLEEGGLIP